MSRRTKKQVEQLQQQIIEVLKEDNPQSVRHVFYRMTDPRLPEPVSKDDSGYRAVQYQLTKLRRSERVPYHWIADESRRGWFTDSFHGADDFIRKVKSLYREDIWQHSKNYCEVWAESKSIAAVIRRVCEELTVDLYPCGGFSSISFAHQSAQSINHNYSDRQVHILYVGDYDQSGLSINESLEKELRLHLDDSVKMEFRRIGITPQQVERYDLPKKNPKPSDKRGLELEYTVEAEAMPAATMRELVRSEVEYLLPSRALEVAKVAEQSEREHLDKMANLLENGSYE